ncbi:MAG TPA: phosphotransferase [Burkholderiaceae bacterium]|nr:phosphotransferase [Burkholderiaceae bacterium]
MSAATETEVPAEFAQALRELGLADAGAIVGTPMTGGVSSEIWLIQTAQGPVCAKRALAKLRVAADWRAPIARNRYEARWMRVASDAYAGCAPTVLGQHPSLGVLVMDYLPPSAFSLWKHRLRDGHADPATAAEVGRVLGKIHSYSARRPELATEFDTDTIFFDIRLEPYLLATAKKHPELASRLEHLVDVTRSNRVALVHGDVSPKNILIGASGPVFLDAECAWWGDPAFDIAFCLNHLLLKCLWTPAATPAFLASYDGLAKAYLQSVDWEPSGVLEQRAAALLPGLFLARIDGKSPVEYVTEERQREQVRRVARELLKHPVASLRSVRTRWAEELEQ